jgi:DNA-binding transcriptional ArsR family regulator
VDIDRVFKALADPSRRLLLDTLRDRAGQSLGELCGKLEMTRQAVTQHLARLEEANLVSSVRRGREKLHYLNPVPIHEIHARWISRFERESLDALRDLKSRAEGDPRGQA